MMIKNWKVFMLAACMLLILGCAVCESAQSDFTIDASGVITGYTGTDTNMVIPAVINGIKVREIGYEAFMDCEDLAGVTISEGISVIGWSAFKGCENLEYVSIPQSVRALGTMHLPAAKA